MNEPFLNFTSKADANINVVLIYENKQAAIRAKSVLDRVSTSFRNEFIFACGVWSFNMLRFAGLIDVAQREISEADLVIISGQSAARVPPEIVSMINSGRRSEGDRPSAVVVLWDEPSEEETAQLEVQAPSGWNQFPEFEEGKGIDFLCDRLRTASAGLGSPMTERRRRPEAEAIHAC